MRPAIKIPQGAPRRTPLPATRPRRAPPCAGRSPPASGMEGAAGSPERRRLATRVPQAPPAPRDAAAGQEPAWASGGLPPWWRLAGHWGEGGTARRRPGPAEACPLFPPCLGRPQHAPTPVPLAKRRPALGVRMNTYSTVRYGGASMDIIRYNGMDTRLARRQPRTSTGSRRPPPRDEVYPFLPCRLQLSTGRMMFKCPAGMGMSLARAGPTGAGGTGGGRP